MTKTFTLLASTAMAFAMTACATSTDDKYTVGVDDNDRFESEVNGVDQNDAKTMTGESMMDKTERVVKDGVNAVENAVMSVGNPSVGGASMNASDTIVQNASKAPNLTTLVAAVQQAELVETLSGDGPFTVFAPTNDAFSYVPQDTVSALMMDDNRADLQKVLTGHVVAGKVTAADLTNQILANNGTYTFTTVSGDTLSAFMTGENVKIADERGYVATVTTADVMQSNGVVHVIDSVLIGE